MLQKHTTKLVGQIARWLTGMAVASLLLSLVFGPLIPALGPTGPKPTVPVAHAANPLAPSNPLGGNPVNQPTPPSTNPADNPNIAGPIPTRDTVFAQTPTIQVLTTISNVMGAQNGFFGKSGSPHDMGMLDVDGQDTGYVGRDDSALGHKYDGNPWVRMNTSSNALHEINAQGNLVNNGYTVTDANVRFVLTEVERQTKTIDTSIGSTIGGTNCLGNIYIFRNEFNPALMVGFYAINGSLGCAGTSAPNADQRHFVLHAGCQNSFAEGSGYLSDVTGPDVGDLNLFGGNHPTDQNDDPQKVKDTLSNTHNVRICTTDSGAFGGALSQAMETLQTIIGDIFSWVKSALLNVVNVGSLSGNTGLVQAWKTIRDLVNIIFIIILSVIALTNILRIDTDRYGIRSLLPRLVFAIIAVNFSFILVQVMTNLASIISQPFISKTFSLLSNPPADGSIIDPTQGIGQFFIALLLVLFVIIGFVVLFLFFAIRILVIWLLTAISPLVFLFMVLPLTRSLSSSWWKNAVKWIFMAPIAFIVLFIAAELLATSGTNENINGPDFALKIAFFLGACIAAVIIPLKLGGEVMGRAVSGAQRAGRGGGGFLGRKTGVSAALQQQKEKGERAAQARGASIRKGVSGVTSAGGRLPFGKKTYQEARLQKGSAMEKEAEMYAGQFNNEQLGDMQGKFSPGSNMHKTLGMAQEIRSGLYSERRAGEQAAQALANFQGKPIEGRKADVDRLNSRNVSEFSPEVMDYLANTTHPQDSKLLQEHMGSAAVAGIMEQGNPEKVEALRAAHKNGRISDTAINNLPDNDRALYEHQIVQGRSDRPPGSSKSSEETPRLASSESSAARSRGTTKGGVSLPQARRTKEPPSSDDIRGI